MMNYNNNFTSNHTMPTSLESIDVTSETVTSSTSQVDMSLGTVGTIEVTILICILCVGGPLNVLSFQKSFRAFRNHKAKSPILLLRINLNIADLITIFIYVPRQIIWMLTYQWLGGEFLCRINSFFSTFSFYLISSIISCISIDRVYGAYNISSLTAHRQSYRRCRSLLSVAWLLALLLSIPQVFIFRIFKPMENFSQCVPLWTVIVFESYPIINNTELPEYQRESVSTQLRVIQNIEHIYNVAHLLFVFWIPCIIIVVSYLTVVFILQGHLSENNVFNCTSCPKREKIGEKLDYPMSASSTMLQAEDSSCVVKVKEEYSFDSNIRCISMAQSKGSNRLGAVAVTTIHKAKQHAKRQAAWIILAYLTFWTPYNVLAVLSLLGFGGLPFPVSCSLDTATEIFWSGPVVVHFYENLEETNSKTTKQVGATTRSANRSSGDWAGTNYSWICTMISLLVFLSTLSMIAAFPPGMQLPPPPRELPPGFAEILPAETVQQLKAVHESETMSPMEKHQKIDQILVNLPEEVADRLPKPPGFDRLPQEVRAQLKSLHRDKSLNWQTRMDKIREFLTGLPEEVRRLLPPMGPPPPSAFRTRQ